MLLAGDDPIEAGGTRTLAWLVGIGLVVLGTVFVLLRKRISFANVVLTFFSIGLSLVMVEATLKMMGFQPVAPFTWNVPEVASWWTVSDREGGRFIGAGYAGDLHFNSQGYPDTDEFNVAAVEGKTKRVMLLGDSFSYGAKASGQDKNFASVLEQSLGDDGVVWNMGIPGSGQKRALISLREFGAVLKPHVVVLQFFENDFGDNLYPPGIHYLFENGKWVNRYTLQPDGTVITLSPDDAYRRAFGSVGLMSLLKSSRLISAVVRLAAGGGRNGQGGAGELDVDSTRSALADIQAECASLDASLVAFLIPDRTDLETPGKKYAKSLELFQELGIDFVEVRTKLKEADYARKPDGHWNDAGHRIGGMAIADRVNGIFADERKSNSARSLPRRRGLDSGVQ